MESIDVFRGLTMLLMVFVNELGGAGFSEIAGFPAWLGHSGNPETIFLADVIAPAFLFIVGMAIPLAVTNRLMRGESNLRIGLHVLTRAASLMIIGLCMGNMRSGRPLLRPLGLNGDLWTLLLILSFILVWTRYPSAGGARRLLFRALRVGGVCLLIGLLAIYREGPDHDWLQCRWYIIGQIGWAYLVCSMLYLAFRRQMGGMVGCLSLLILLAIGDHYGVFNPFHFLDSVRRYVPFADLIGICPAVTLAGVIVGMLFTETTPAPNAKGRIVWIVTFAAGLLLARFFLRPVDVAFNRFLFGAAISCIIYAFLYWLVDVRKIQHWAHFLTPVGRNCLLAYFLSFMLHPLLNVLGIHGLNDYLRSG